MEYLSTAEHNENCYSSGPLSDEGAYEDLKGYGPIEALCYDETNQKEYNFACRKYYNTDAIDAGCASLVGVDQCLDNEDDLYWRACNSATTHILGEVGYLYFSMEGHYNFWISMADYELYLEEWGTDMCEENGPMQWYYQAFYD